MIHLVPYHVTDLKKQYLEYLCCINMNYIWANFISDSITTIATNKGRRRSIIFLLKDFSLLVVLTFLHVSIFISRPAGDYNLHHVCACVRVCLRECVTQFSLKLLQLHIFGKLLVLMNFYALQYFLGLVNFGLLLSRAGTGAEKWHRVLALSQPVRIRITATFSSYH